MLTPKKWVLGTVFQHAHIITNTEVSIQLEQYVAAQKQADPNYRMNPMLEKTQQYVDRFSSIKNRETAQQVRE